MLVPIYARENRLHVVLTLRREDLWRHPGEISLPGGRCEDGEADPRVTALREAEEEIGLSPRAVEIVGALRPTPTITTRYAIYPFVGMIEPPRSWRLSPSEVTAVIELPLQALRDGHAPRRLIRGGRAIETDTYRVGEHLIWGATARILADLLGRLSAAAALPTETV